MNKKQIVSVVFAGATLLLSGCATDFLSSTSSTLDAATPDITLNNFVDTRIATLKKEAAVGEGENIEALAQLIVDEGGDAPDLILCDSLKKFFDDLSFATQLYAEGIMRERVEKEEQVEESLEIEKLAREKLVIVVESIDKKESYPSIA